MFPLSVYFTHDANYSPEMERLARAGFDRWTSASGDLVRYQVVNSSTKANVTVRFDPGTDNGLTHTAFYGSRIVHAEINVGVRDGDETDVEAIAAHEFGHALGIDGHSDNPRDLMYPVHYRGTEGIITARDLNTLATEYPAIVHAVGEDAPPVQARRGSGQPKA